MKSFGRVVVAASAAVAFTAGSALVAPVVGADPLGSLGSGSLGSVGDNCGEQVVTSVNNKGDAWTTPDDESKATIEATKPESAKVGPAALTFKADAAKGTSLYKNVDISFKEILNEGKPISLGYDYTSSGQAPALQIRLNNANVDKSNDKTGFASVYWSPEPATGTWKEAKPGEDAKFYITRDILDADNTVVIEKHTATTLKAIVDANPEASIVGYGVQQTKDNTATDVAIDNFQFGCEVTNFEAPADPGFLGSLTGIFGS